MLTSCVVSQSMTFMRLLTLLIGDLIRNHDPSWECILLLHTICSTSTAFAVTQEHSPELAWLVEAHHEMFCKDTITPKMHILIHLPKQILR